MKTPIRLNSFSTYLHYILLGFILTIVAYARIRLLHTPLERDEGEFAYMGQLLLKGIPPYAEAYAMKLPGVFAAYALIMMIFGQSPFGIHVGLLIVNGLCIVLVYFLGCHLFNKSTATISCASYALLSLSQSVYGIHAHATHFVVLFVLAGTIILLCCCDNGRLPLIFISGLCFGLAFTMKQHAVMLLVFALLYLVIRLKRPPAKQLKYIVLRSVLFLSATVIPFIIVAISLKMVGTFEKFWFWTFTYAREYASGQSLATGLQTFTEEFSYIIAPQLPLWIIAGAGCLLLTIMQKDQSDRLFIFGFLLFSFLAICPGFYFRPHYFVMILPAVAILIGFASYSVEKQCTCWELKHIYSCIPTLLFIAAVIFGIYQEQEYLFSRTPLEVSRATYDDNPFPEALQIGRYLKEHTSSIDRIAVLGSEPEILFYADRLSATGYLCVYSLMEIQPYSEKMQLQMIHEIEAAEPAFIVMVDVETSWLAQPGSSLTLVKWAHHYIEHRYELIGAIDTHDISSTFIIFPNNTPDLMPRSSASITVFKKRASIKST